MTAIVPRLHNTTRHIALSSLRDARVQHYPVAPLASSTYRSLTPTRKLVVLAPWRVTLPKANSNAKNVRKESRDGIRKYIKRTHTHTHTHTHVWSPSSIADFKKSGQFTSPPSVISRNAFEANSKQAKTDLEHPHPRPKQATSNNTAHPHQCI
jgi:hypothetical protein